MNILYLLIPLALVLLGIAIWAFMWAVRSGQFEDLEGPAHRILMDDDDPLVPRQRPPVGDDPAGERSAEKSEKKRP
jgi:cbb3-type cytochrome oxidase maturation protein